LARGWGGRQAEAPKGDEVAGPAAGGQMSLGLETGGSRAELDAWRSRRERLRYLTEAGEVVERGVVRDGIRAGMAELFAALDRALAGELPPAVVGLRELEVRGKVKEALEAAKAGFRGRMAGLGGGIKEGENNNKEEVDGV